MKRLRTAVFRILMALLLAGCAAAVPTVEKTDIAAPPSIPPVAEKRPAPRILEDQDIFSRGLSVLARTDGSNQAEARSVFVSLLERYPQSRWRPAAETIIRLIDEGQAMREARRQDRALSDQTLTEKEWLLQENDRMKKTVRELTDKLQA
ncbi:MAG: hypothetical protein KKF28_02355, partial [Proteobacteria bacterium]|nr:hypothetical protein [Pseudomonadota bacterium]